MPHTLESISGGDLVIVSELHGSRVAKAADSIPFVHILLSADPLVAGPVTSGSSKVVSVADASLYTVGEFIEIREGANRDYTSITARDTGADTITLKTLANGYTIAAKVYQLEIAYDMAKITGAGGDTEITAVSLYGSVRDQMILRKMWSVLTAAEFTRMAAVLGVSLIAGTRAEQVSQIYDALLARTGAEPKASGPGVLDQNIFKIDGGEFVSFSKGSFDDQFESASGSATFDEYSFEIPFDCFLQRASVYTNAASNTDAYVTITKNDVTVLVAAGAAPPNRNLPAVTGQKKGVDLSNVLCAKGDKITVRLNIVGANVISRCKVAIGYAARLIPLP